MELNLKVPYCGERSIIILETSGLSGENDHCYASLKNYKVSYYNKIYINFSQRSHEVVTVDYKIPSYVLISTYFKAFEADYTLTMSLYLTLGLSLTLGH